MFRTIVLSAPPDGEAAGTEHGLDGLKNLVQGIKHSQEMLKESRDNVYVAMTTVPLEQTITLYQWVSSYRDEGLRDQLELLCYEEFCNKRVHMIPVELSGWTNRIKNAQTEEEAVQSAKDMSRVIGYIKDSSIFAIDNFRFFYGGNIATFAMKRMEAMSLQFRFARERNSPAFKSTPYDTIRNELDTASSELKKKLKQHGID